MGRRVSKTRNLGEYTEAQYWGVVRSALRNAFRYWKPLVQAKVLARRNCKGCGRQKYEYKCASCGDWFAEKEIEIDHVNMVGSLKSENDLASFLKALTPEDVNEFQVLCKSCHRIKTNLEMKERRQKK